MSSNTKIRLAIIAAVTLACIYGIIGLPTSKAALMNNWSNNIRLGTDLRGGSNLVMQVQMQDAFKAEADAVILRLRDELAKASVPFADMNRNDPDFDHANDIQINVTGVPATKAGDFRMIVNDNYGSVWILTTVNETDYRLTMKPSEALRVRTPSSTAITRTTQISPRG